MSNFMKTTAAATNPTFELSWDNETLKIYKKSDANREFQELKYKSALAARNQEEATALINREKRRLRVEIRIKRRELKKELRRLDKITRYSKNYSLAKVITKKV